MSECVIQINNISRDYGSFRAVNDVSMSIQKDRIVALLGPNGAGKTTLLHLVMGMLEPTEGYSSVFGVDSRRMGAKESSSIGYIGDSEEPPGWMSVRGLINLQAEASNKFDREFMGKFLAEKKLSLNKHFGSMSKGQKKWLRAGLVLAFRPVVIIMDEPAEGLDSASRNELYDYLREYITENQATAIIATHIIGDIERIADDAAIIHKGQLHAYWCLEDLREQVCEIYSPDGSLPKQIDDCVEIVGKKVVDDGVMFWVSCQTSTDILKQQTGNNINIQHVDLQTYYLAVTKNGIKQERDRNEN